MRSVLSDARRGHIGLFGFAAVMLAAVPVLAVLAVLDDRTLLGAPVWLKPLKFSVSFAAYAGALAWMMGRLRRPAGSTAGWVIVVASAAEMAIIVVQAGRGVRATSTPTAVSGRSCTPSWAPPSWCCTWRPW